MKIVIVGVLLVVMIVVLCHPAESSVRENDRLSALGVMLAIDYQQSVKMFHKSEGYVELNPAYGTSKPGKAALAAWSGGWMAAAYGLDLVVPDGMLKDIVWDSVLATQMMNIEENQRAINDGSRSFHGIMVVVSGEF